MKAIRKQGITLASIGLVVGAAAGMASLDGCGGEGGLCGPCGSVVEGQVSISGNAQLDGFFAAVSDLGRVTGSVQADFDANIIALAEVWGYADLVADGNITADVVGQLMGNISADLQASVDGGITLAYVPPRCSANVSVAVEASAQCEAQAGCDVEVDPGEVSVSCEGTCSGSCSAGCSGGFQCEASAGIACEGSCEGSCDLSAGGMCEGTCNGQCDGNCEVVVQNADGTTSCEGACSGTCTGSCELSAGGSCSGTCHGTCKAEAEFDCNGSPPQCNGSCEGECSGSCQGEARPPSASADCEASANCEASASAQASANIECSPPSLEFRFNLAADLQGDAGVAARAEFEAKMTALRVRGAAILQGMAQLGALVTGEVNGELVFDPPPLLRIQSQFEGVISAAGSGEFDIAPGRIDCVIPALQEAAQVLAGVAGETSGTIAAQAQFSADLFAVAG